MTNESNESSGETENPKGDDLALYEALFDDFEFSDKPEASYAPAPATEEVLEQVKQFESMVELYR